jgi:lipoate-protein ligase A
VHPGWRISDSHGDAGAFHTRAPEPTRQVTFHTVEHPTLALGSAQSTSDVDGRVAAALGVEVVQRRSGGGAVLMLPGEFVWMDVVIPAGDPKWSDDVAGAMRWVGEWWAEALASLGVPGRVHDGRMVRDEWSGQVCWSGVGTGEVLGTVRTPAGKIVGISQRRTRTSARFQTMCHLRWHPELVAALVAAPRPAAAALASSAEVVPATAATVRAALLATIPD